EKHSRVLVILDVSPSIARTTDRLPDETTPTDKLPTRLDDLVRTLSDEQLAFLQKLLERNPVVLYRFGSRLDEDSATIPAGGAAWQKADWERWLKLDLKLWLLSGLSEGGREVLRAHPEFESDKPGTVEWAMAWAKRDTGEIIPPVSATDGPGPKFTETDRTRLLDNRDKLDKRIEVLRQLQQGTNVAGSVLQLLNRESNNMVQGLVVFSDGRSNLGSESTFGELRDKARREKVPVFTVLVGEDRQPVSIAVTDVQS